MKERVKKRERERERERERGNCCTNVCCKKKSSYINKEDTRVSRVFSRGGFVVFLFLFLFRVEGLLSFG